MYMPLFESPWFVKMPIIILLPYSDMVVPARRSLRATVKNSRKDWMKLENLEKYLIIWLLRY